MSKDQAMATISVIIPVYNAGNYIERCLNSVLSQSYPRLEILCVDDGSADDSNLLMDSVAAIDDRVVAIHKPRGGKSDKKFCFANQFRGINNIC